MNEHNPNNRERFLMLYPEDFDNYSTWEDICEVVGVSCECSEIRINFDYSDVVVIEEEDEEEEEDDDDEDEYY